MELFDFGVALNHLKQGKRVGRKEWKNALCVFLVAGSEFEVSRPPLNQFYTEGTRITYRAHIDMVGADNTVGTWAPSMVDVLMEDWYVLEA